MVAYTFSLKANEHWIQIDNRNLKFCIYLSNSNWMGSGTTHVSAVIKGYAHVYIMEIYVCEITEYPNGIVLSYVVVSWQRFQFDGNIKHW